MGAGDNSNSPLYRSTGHNYMRNWGEKSHTNKCLPVNSCPMAGEEEVSLPWSIALGK
jgi:hypothetical protein